MSTLQDIQKLVNQAERAWNQGTLFTDLFWQIDQAFNQCQELDMFEASAAKKKVKDRLRKNHRDPIDISQVVASVKASNK